MHKVGAVASTVVVLGDSISAGTGVPPGRQWPALLQERLEREHRGRWVVRNAGAPGDTAPLGLARFDRDVAGCHPQVVLIAFGLNDCHPYRRALDRFYEGRVPAGMARWYPWRAALRRGERTLRGLGVLSPPDAEKVPVPLPRTTGEGFSAALLELARRTRQLGARPVLLTMTPLGPSEASGAAVRAATYGAYNGRIRRAAAEQGVGLVELSEGAPAGAWTEDGVHLSEGGQAWVAGEVFAQLEQEALW